MLLTTLLYVLAQLKYHGSHLTQKKKNKQCKINKELFITKFQTLSNPGHQCSDISTPPCEAAGMLCHNSQKTASLAHGLNQYQ